MGRRKKVKEEKVIKKVVAKKQKYDAVQKQRMYDNNREEYNRVFGE